MEHHVRVLIHVAQLGGEKLLKKSFTLIRQETIVGIEKTAVGIERIACEVFVICHGVER